MRQIAEQLVDPRVTACPLDERIRCAGATDDETSLFDDDEECDFVVLEEAGDDGRDLGRRRPTRHRVGHVATNQETLPGGAERDLLDAQQVT